MSELHETRPVQVWVDVDAGIAPMVEELNAQPGGREAYVMVGWLNDEAFRWLDLHYCLKEVSEAMAYAHPKEELMLEHRWKTIRDTGKTVYEECTCGERRVRQRPGGYQPIDWAWLGEEYMKKREPIDWRRLWGSEAWVWIIPLVLALSVAAGLISAAGACQSFGWCL